MMAAIAITLGLNGAAELWEWFADPTVNWVQTTEAPASADGRACVTIPVHVEDGGDLF